MGQGREDNGPLNFLLVGNTYYWRRPNIQNSELEIVGKNSGATLKFWASVMSYVGNSQQSVGKFLLPQVLIYSAAHCVVA